MNYRTKRKAAQIFHSVNMCEDGENSEKIISSAQNRANVFEIMGCSNASLDNLGNETLSELSIQAGISNQTN